MCCCSCFGKQDWLCLSNDKMPWRKTDGAGDSDERESESKVGGGLVQMKQRPKKCPTLWCDLFKIDFCKNAPFLGEMEG